LLSALLRQQQRNEIMKTVWRSVNRFFYFVQPAAQLRITRRPSHHKAFALGFPSPRAFIESAKDRNSSHADDILQAVF
ncbi:hypothetical protein AB4Y36_19410, partial [Paraburkholderia sp. BR10936]|uniref:hypothetical protein n=1 Tax=Paraburkholderia sp. BR10936 TaxID=3236993 RepID=UPI0034D1CFBA